MLTLKYILKSRGHVFAGEIYSKPCPDDGGGVRKPRPKPENEPFIKEGEFKV